MRFSADQNSVSKPYTLIIEQGATSFGGYVADLPGCVAVGETELEVIELIREAIEFHLEDLAGV